MCNPPPLETGVAGVQYGHWAEALGPPTPTSVYAHSPCQNVFTPLSSLGNSLQALQVGIVLLPPWARAPSKNSAASALPFSLRRGAEAAPQALLQEGSPSPGTISSAGPRADEKGRVLEDPSEKGSGKRHPGRPSPAACKRNGSQ